MKLTKKSLIAPLCLAFVFSVNIAPAASARERAPHKNNRQISRCAAQSDRITTIMNNSADQAARQLAIFRSIADKAVLFMNEKQLSVGGYAERAAELDTAHKQAEQSISNLKSAAEKFNCDNRQPRATVANFKSQAAKKRTALKHYKSAVRNLVVAIKTSHEAQKDTQ